MSTTTNVLTFSVLGSESLLELDGYTAIVAGYTGRDRAAVDRHIHELAALGIAPPPRVPMFYDVPASSISSEPRILASGSRTSGEVEPLYIRHAGRYYLGVASDHTDRELEASDIAQSKRACPKPVGSAVIPIPELASLSLDTVRARTWVDGSLYQDGTLDNLRSPSDVIGLLLEESPTDGDFICLGGTIPVIDGDFRYGTSWSIELELSNGVLLTHDYVISKGDQQ